MSTKNKEVIENFGAAPNELVVQKSTPLFSLWQSDLTLPECKIMDTYLARINSHDPEHRTVTFDKSDLEELLGVTRLTTPILKTRLRHLMSNTVEIPDPDDPDQYKIVTLFEEASVYKDECGKMRVNLECTQKAMRYFFNVEHLGYLRYKLRCITHLSSRYTYIMFLYLEQNRFRKTWEVAVDDLKKILSCDQEETYKEYKYFNQLLLKRIKKEIDAKTECRYTYEPVKRGRTVIRIRFTLETLPKDVLPSNEVPGQITLNEYAQSRNYLWAEPIAEFNFSNERLDEIASLLHALPQSQLPELDTTDDINLRRYHYMAQKAAEIKRRDSEKAIRSKFAYLKTIIQKDAK